MPPSLVQRISDCFTRRQARPRSTRSRTSQRELLPPIGFRSWPAAPSSTRPTRSCRRRHWSDCGPTARQMSPRSFAPFCSSPANCRLSCAPPSMRGSLGLPSTAVGGCWARDWAFRSSGTGSPTFAHRLARSRTPSPLIRILLRRRQPRPAPVDGCGRTHASGYDRSTMSLPYRAAVLHEPRTPLAIEQVTATALAPSDVLVRVRAAGLCHTDLEVIDGSLRYPMPIVLGHEAAGVIEQVGPAVSKVRKGDHVVLSWNPHCGHCFYCDRDLPILCEDYLAKGPQAVQLDGACKAQLASGGALRHLMFLGAFGDYCIVQDQQAIAVPKEMPFDRACLIGCGVMTGGAAV